MSSRLSATCSQAWNSLFFVDTIYGRFLILGILSKGVVRDSTLCPRPLAKNIFSYSDFHVPEITLTPSIFKLLFISRRSSLHRKKLAFERVCKQAPLTRRLLASHPRIHRFTQTKVSWESIRLKKVHHNLVKTWYQTPGRLIRWH